MSVEVSYDTCDNKTAYQKRDVNNLSDLFKEHKRNIIDFIDGVRKQSYEQGRKDAIDEFANWLVKKGIFGSRCVYNGEITDYGKVYVNMFLDEMKGETNE